MIVRCVSLKKTLKLHGAHVYRKVHITRQTLELLQGEFEVELAGHRDLANGRLRDGSAETYFLAETEVCRPYT